MGIGSSKPAVDDGDRKLVAGRPDLERCDNKISTSKYTVLNFFPIVSMVRQKMNNLVMARTQSLIGDT